MKNKLRALFGFILLTTPLTATAQQPGDFTYTPGGSGIIITGYTGPGGAVIIPETIGGLPVTFIAAYAFIYNTNLTSVTLPNSLVSIGGEAFGSCTSLTSVTIGNSVTNIGNSAFYSCTSLTNVAIPNSVTSIGGAAFRLCTNLSAITVDALNSVYSSVDGVLFNKNQTLLIQFPGGKTGTYTIPDGVTRIASSSFSYCTSLTNVTIPNSVTNVVLGAFRFCTSLSAITVDPLDSVYSSVDGVLFDKSQTLLIQYPGGKAGSYTLPNSTTTIGQSAFADCTSLTNVAIPNNVTSIRSLAFGYCFDLTNVTIENGLTSIGSYAFISCTSLSSVTLPHTVTNIGERAFDSCSRLTAITVDPLNSVFRSVDGVLFNKSQSLLIEYPGGKAGTYSIPNGATGIGNYAFYSCTSLSSVTIPDSVATIGDSAFASCAGLASVTIGNGITSLGLNAFYFCTNLTSVTLPEGVTTIGIGSFQGCMGLTSVTIPGSVTHIADQTFAGCTSLIGVTIPDSVTTIGNSAFHGCTSLTNVTIPSSVTSIAWWAFDYCTNLEGVVFKGNPPSFFPSEAFANTNSVIVYYLPGTTGWATTIAGRPTRLWNPVMQSNGPNFGVGPAGFGFNITGNTNIPIVIEASTGLTNGSWVPLQSLNLTNGAFYFSDPNWTNYPARTYRIRSP